MSLPAPQPRLTHALSSDASRFLSLRVLHRSASGVPEGAIEIDLRHRLVPWDARRFSPAERGTPVAAVWMRPLPSDQSGERRLWLGLAEQVIEKWRPKTLIIEMPPGDLARNAGSTMASLRRLLRSGDDAATRWAAGLPTLHLQGGRSHLVQLRALRHFAEEWDFDVAVDVAGALDQQWEAEAGIARLGSRISLIRVPSAALESVPVGRNRVAMRALNAALDSQAPLCVAVLPRVAPWQATSPSAVVRGYADATGRLHERLRQLRVDSPFGPGVPPRGQRSKPSA